METRRKWQYTLGTLALVLGLGVGGRPAQAATPVCPSCGGAPLGPGGSFVLTCDVGPCAVGPALTVNSASLNMNSHTVSCSDNTIDGVVLTGTKATLLNGTVTGCFDGVELQGTGSHEVTNVTSTGNANFGFDEVSGSNANKLSSNTASNNGRVVPDHTCPGSFCCDFTVGFGFDLNGNGNILRSNSATGNFDDGFRLDGSSNNLAGDKSNTNDVDSIPILCNDNVTVFSSTTDAGGDGFDANGDSNLLSGVTANGNADDGVDIDGNKNRVTGSTANGNDNDGMVVNGGGHNTFSSNTANNNTDDGFAIDFGSGVKSLTGNKADGNSEGFEIDGPSGNILSGNTATKNGDGFEIENYSDNNLLKANVALNNYSEGITIEGGHNNIISSNKALGNPDFDLEDTNGSCDANAWVANTFGSANQSCIH